MGLPANFPGTICSQIQCADRALFTHIRKNSFTCLLWDLFGQSSSFSGHGRGLNRLENLSLSVQEDLYIVGSLKLLDKVHEWYLAGHFEDWKTLYLGLAPYRKGLQTGKSASVTGKGSAPISGLAS